MKSRLASISHAVSRFGLGAIFLWAALSKLSALGAWSATLPPLIAGNHPGTVAGTIVAAELALGIALITNRFCRAAHFSGVVMLAAFSGFLVTREIYPELRTSVGCGCFGLPTDKAVLTDTLWFQLSRNAAMAGACIWNLVSPGSTRSPDGGADHTVSS